MRPNPAIVLLACLLAPLPSRGESPALAISDAPTVCEAADPAISAPGTAGRLDEAKKGTA
jgi:hypothetical protein